MASSIRDRECIYFFSEKYIICFGWESLKCLISPHLWRIHRMCLEFSWCNSFFFSRINSNKVFAVFYLPISLVTFSLLPMPFFTSLYVSVIFLISSHSLNQKKLVSVFCVKMTWVNFHGSPSSQSTWIRINV